MQFQCLQKLQIFSTAVTKIDDDYWCSNEELLMQVTEIVEATKINNDVQII